MPSSSNSLPDAADFCGLVNQAMTCYLNSLLQTLFMTPEFRNALYRSVNTLYRSVNTLYRSVNTLYRSVNTLYMSVNTLYRSVNTLYRSVNTLYRLVYTVYCMCLGGNIFMVIRHKHLKKSASHINCRNFSCRCRQETTGLWRQLP